MSKKSIGTGITRLLFGLGKKEMKVIPYNEMTPEQFEQLDRFLGKIGFAVANDTVSLTKKQSEYILDQVRQLDLYRKNMMRDPDLVRVDKMTELKDPEFKGFTPKVIEGGKGKTKPGKINYDKMEKFLGVKLRGDETFDELLEIEKRMKNKDPEDFAKGGIVDLITKLRSKFGKKAITTADKIDRPAKAKLKKEFEAFEERIGNRRLTEDELDELYEEFDEAVPYPMETVADRNKFLKEQKDYQDAMFRDYKAGKLDPQPGEVSRGRLKQLQDKLEEAEMSGDKRLITQDEMEELDFLEKKFRKEDLDVKAQVGRDMTQEEIEELKTLSDMDYAEGGIATMFRPKLKNGGPSDYIDPGYLGIPPIGLGTGSRPGGNPFPSLDDYDNRGIMRKRKKKKKKKKKDREEFIFGGGVGLKGYLKMLAEGRKTKEGKAFKGSDTLKYGNPKSQVPKFAKQFISDKDKAEMKRLRIAQLENVLEGLKSDRQFLASYEKMANLFPEVNKLSYDMLEELLPAQHKKRFKGLTTEMLDKEILQVENVLKNLKVGKDQRALNADGGLATMFRPKLKDGGPPNPGRRTFLKLMAGLASIPVVGKLFKPATKVAKIVPLKNTTTEMPTWFPDFVEKMTIRNVGNKIDADITLFEDPKLPGVKVYKYDDGRVSVEGQNEYYANYEIDYKPPGYEVIDYETGKAVRTKGEFEAVDADPVTDYDGSIADYEPRVLESVDGIMSSDARRMEGYAKDVDPNKLPLKSGEGSVIENEVRAESAMDAAREAAEEIDDFADGGLATMFRKK